MNVPAGARREGTVRVRDGRSVGFAEWGDPTGQPVLLFHGAPGSRLMALGGEETAERLGLRLVCLERPGYGVSDFAADRTVAGWADDVADATGVLGLQDFAVAGVSAGAPYALACGARLGGQVRQVGVISGMTPPELRPDDVFVELIRRDRVQAEAAAREHFRNMAADIGASVAGMATQTGPDQIVYASSSVQERFARTREEAFRGGVDAAVLDLLLVNESWGFELRDVVVPTRWWHGTLDSVSLLKTASAATHEIVESELTVFEGEGHAIGFTHGIEILRALTQAA